MPDGQVLRDALARLIASTSIDAVEQPSLRDFVQLINPNAAEIFDEVKMDLLMEYENVS